MSAALALAAESPQPAGGGRHTGGDGRPPLSLVPAARPAQPEARAWDWIEGPVTAMELRVARRKARGALPAPPLAIRGMAFALLEVEAGCRSAEQLERCCRPDAWERLNRRLARSGGAFVTNRALLRVHWQELTPGLVDGVAVVRRGGRVAAIAMRLDAGFGRWTITELCF